MNLPNARNMVINSKISSLRRRTASMVAVLAGVMLLMMATGCGTKKNTPLSRNWQAFTTR